MGFDSGTGGRERAATMQMLQDTIAAPATPAGTSALAVIRISGPDTAALAKALAGRSPAPRRAVHVDYRNRDGVLLDDVLLTFFAGPASYTGEDALEIATHGNPFVVQKVLEDLMARGCRAAGPGEFTQRAFLNGKMDLSQAEAVMDVIQARSERALAAAQEQLRGALGRRVEGLVERLLGVLARVEAYIDFPDEDLPKEDKRLVENEIRTIMESIAGLTATSRYGAILRDGLKTVLIGAPNVGKSSLLNALVGHDRALVSPEPGTTRDFIEERLMVGPHCLRLIDTAGLNPSPAPLEKRGIEKTLARTEEADLFLVVIDGSEGRQEYEPLPKEVLGRLAPGNTIVVRNKIDLAAPDAALPCPAELCAVGVAQWIDVSALRGSGIEELRQAIIGRADAFSGHDESGIAVSSRHAVALDRSKAALQEAKEKLDSGAPVELMSADLRAALDALAEITGRIDNERMLDSLFATFCIGK